MIKVFLVDDEISIRENLRNSFPWQEEGYILVGEAPDGEMALPMIRDLNPDILLTDIRMPFMDGMQLCAQVNRTMPWINMIILSGFDDFSYAKQAISLGVKEYLLKPITAAELSKALSSVKEKILQQRHERDNIAALRRRINSGNQFLRDKLLASLFAEDSDHYDDQALLSQMRNLGVNLTANCYCVIDISFDNEGEERAACREVLSAFSENSGGTVFVCGAPKGARALILGDNENDVQERAYSYASSVMHLPQLEKCEHLLMCIGETVSDYYSIRQSMQSARGTRHRLIATGVQDRTIVGADETLSTPEFLQETDLSPLHESLQYAAEEDVEKALMNYVATLDPHLAVGYLRVAAVISAGRIIQQAGGSGINELDKSMVQEALNTDGEQGIHKLAVLLRSAIRFRNNAGKGYNESPISRARSFLSQNYQDPSLMLQDAADHIGLSQSHFSTLFSQETGITFTQYLTGLRIGKAKELLTATDMRSSQIAFQVGYNDPHYFSYLFKKTTGQTPSEFRKENNQHSR